MVSSIVYNGDGTTRIFPVDFKILGDNFVRVYVDDVEVTDKRKYDIINNSIVFTTNETPPIGEGNVQIYVATSESELGDLGAPLTDITIVAQNIADINDVGQQVVPNLPEILQADDNATIATQKALEASNSATSASESATIASTKAGEASTSANNASISEANALAYRDTASTQAGIATTKAGEASNSATSASDSASQAEAFAQQAQLSAESVDADNLVHKTGDETISGIKTFTSSPIVPTPTTDTQVANKAYVDAKTEPLTQAGGILQKPVMFAPLLTKTAPDTVQIPANTSVYVGGKWITTSSAVSLGLDTDLDTGAKVAGTDYCVYAKADGSFYLSANRTITTDQLIGGFHYGLVDHTEAPTGNKTEADMVKLRGINAYSLWDLKFRPVASPKGMVFVKGRWYDIYLCNSEHITNGTSKAGATIAGGTLTNGRAYPKIPLEFGGDNTLTYGSFKWFHACEIAKAHSKQLINYAEFQTIAYGVKEGVDASAVDGGGATIEHYDYLTSKWGIEQATGTQRIWSNDLANGYGTTSFSWQNVTEGRGQIYATSNAPVAVILGGYRGDGVHAGSRASRWSIYVWYADSSIGCRFACDHFMLA